MKWKIIGFFLSTSNFAIKKRIFRSVELRSFNFLFLFFRKFTTEKTRCKVNSTCQSFDSKFLFEGETIFDIPPSSPTDLSFSQERKNESQNPSTILDNATGREYKQGETPGIVGRRANATMSRDALDYPIRNGGCSPRPNRDSSEARAHTHKLHILKRRVWEHAGRSR